MIPFTLLALTTPFDSLCAVINGNMGGEFDSSVGLLRLKYGEILPRISYLHFRYVEDMTPTIRNSTIITVKNGSAKPKKRQGH